MHDLEITLYKLNLQGKVSANHYKCTFNIEYIKTLFNYLLIPWVNFMPINYTFVYWSSCLYQWDCIQQMSLGHLFSSCRLCVPSEYFCFVQDCLFLAHSFHFFLVWVLFGSYEIVKFKHLFIPLYTQGFENSLGGFNKMSRQIKLGLCVSWFVVKEKKKHDEEEVEKKH